VRGEKGESHKGHDGKKRSRRISVKVVRTGTISKFHALGLTFLETFVSFSDLRDLCVNLLYARHL
jgi:hypothetical protein